MADLALYLLASPRLEKDGNRVEMDTRKAFALLAYLAMTGESHSREALSVLFWPDYRQSHARAALRRTLSTLNKALGEGGLEIRQQDVRISQTANLWVDVLRFQELLAGSAAHPHPPDEACPACLPLLREAVELYKGRFLAGFTLRDSQNFDDWQFFQGDSLQRDLAKALAKLVEIHARHTAFEQAIEYARRWLLLDPLLEEAHRVLMKLYLWSGQRNAALRQYRECVRILERELGVSPLDETTRLYQAILENRTGELEPPKPYQDSEKETRRAHPGAAEKTTSGPPVEIGHLVSHGYPLVGRDRELEWMRQAYQSLASDGFFYALEGEAGIGKTRLAEELLAFGRAQGATTLTARCYPGENNLAYGPFIGSLDDALSLPRCIQRLRDVPQPWLVEAARLAPQIALIFPSLDRPATLQDPGAQSRFFEGVLRVVSAMLQETPPGILLFDDLHFADSATLDLLTYMVRRLQGKPFFLLATWRGDETPHGRRLNALAAEANRSGRGALLALSRLSYIDVEKLVRSTSESGSPQLRDLSKRLHQEAEGLPFFVVEYLSALSEGLEQEQGERWAMPQSVRDLLYSRLAAVSETGQQLLATAAVLGRSFDFDSLHAASGRSESETVNGLEELIVRGLVKEQSRSQAFPFATQGSAAGFTYDFSHEKLRTLVYEETSLARRRLLHRRVAETLAAQLRNRRDSGTLASQIAHHFRAAGLDPQAAEFDRLAGDHARALFAHAEALAHYRTALAMDFPRPAELHQAIGDIQTLGADYKAAIASYETAAALCAPECLANLEHKLGNVYHRLGGWDLAERHFYSAQEAFHEDQANGEKARLYADWSCTAHRRGDSQRALSMAHQALSLAEAGDDAQALAQVHNILGILSRSIGEHDRAVSHLESSLELARKMEDPVAQVAALNNLALVESDKGDFSRAVQLTRSALELCTRLGDRHREAALHNNLADLLHALGEQEAAMEHLKRAVVIFADIGAATGEEQPEIWKLTEW